MASLRRVCSPKVQVPPGCALSDPQLWEVALPIALVVAGIIRLGSLVHTGALLRTGRKLKQRDAHM